MKNSGQFKKGKAPWNKGLTKNTDSRINYTRPTTFKKGRIVSKETQEKINKAKIGYKVTDETKDKIRKTLMGHHHMTDSGRERLRQANLGKVYSKGQLKQMSKRMTGEGNPMFGRSGKLAPAWEGGISFLSYPKEFNKKLKNKIRDRDNHTCQECKYTEEQLGYTLHIHHIDYDKKNNNKNNLISLCRNCHAQTNFKREDWSNYFQDRVVGGVN